MGGVEVDAADGHEAVERHAEVGLDEDAPVPRRGRVDRGHVDLAGDVDAMDEDGGARGDDLGGEERWADGDLQRDGGHGLDVGGLDGGLGAGVGVAGGDGVERVGNGRPVRVDEGGEGGDLGGLGRDVEEALDGHRGALREVGVEQDEGRGGRGGAVALTGAGPARRVAAAWYDRGSDGVYAVLAAPAGGRLAGPLRLDDPAARESQNAPVIVHEGDTWQVYWQERDQLWRAQPF